MNSQEKQKLRVSFWRTLGALAGAGVLLLYPLLRGAPDPEVQRALNQAESIGFQAWELENRKAQHHGVGSRGPASEGPDAVLGTLGLDPWGQPFHYRIRTEPQGHSVEVWTEGPQQVRTQVAIPNSPH